MCIDDYMRGALYAEFNGKIPVISDSLRRANALAILKELYAIGEIDQKNYTDALLEIAKTEGFKFKQT